jgi:sortase A
MRNIGVIFILVLIGMLIWKASQQEHPDLSSRVATGAISPEAEAEVSPPAQIDLNPLPLPAQGIVPQVSEVVPPPPENLADIAPTFESKARVSRNEDKSGERIQASKEFDRILIPALKVNASVISKAYSELTWDLSNLEQNVAALDDIPVQSSNNNIVLAGHVTVRDGSHGPFRYLWRLNPGDSVILQDDNFIYTYVVREQLVVYPEESSVLNDTPQPQLTLITCTTWDEDTSTYLRRRVIFADLEKKETRQILLD